MALAGVCTFLGAYITQPLLPYLRGVFRASEVSVSLTVGAVMLGVALAAPLVGLLAERIGRKRVIVPAIFLSALPTLLAAASPSLHALIVWRFLEGLCIPGILAVMLAYIGEEWPAGAAGFVTSLYIAGGGLGAFLGRFLSGVITVHAGWRWAFIVPGLLTLSGGLAVGRWLPRAQHFVRAVSGMEMLRSAVGHLRNPRLLAIFAMGFAILFVPIGTFSYAAFYLAASPFRLDAAQLSSIYFVYLLALLVTPLAGRFLDRRGFRKTILLAFALSVGGLALTLAASLPVVIAGLALLACAVLIFQSSATTRLGQTAGGARSSAAGLYVTFYYVGGSFATVVPAWFWVHGGWPATVGLLSVAAAAILGFGLLASRQPADDTSSQYLEATAADRLRALNPTVWLRISPPPRDFKTRHAA